MTTDISYMHPDERILYSLLVGTIGGILFLVIGLLFFGASLITIILGAGSWLGISYYCAFVSLLKR